MRCDPRLSTGHRQADRRGHARVVEAQEQPTDASEPAEEARRGAEHAARPVTGPTVALEGHLRQRRRRSPRRAARTQLTIRTESRPRGMTPGVALRISA